MGHAGAALGPEQHGTFKILHLSAATEQPTLEISTRRRLEALNAENAFSALKFF
jgi:hypothetical protein